MQSLAWSTVVILVLLLPGFFFFVGMVVPEQFARDVTPRNPLGALAATVLVSFLSHAFLSRLAPVVGDPVDWVAVLDAIQLAQPRTGDIQGSAQRAAEAYGRNPIAIPMYVAGSCLMGWLTGIAVGWGVVTGRLRLLVKHSWTYGFKPGSRGKVPYAHVLTNVENKEHVLQYRGRLLYFNLNADGTFAYVVLALTEQRFLVLDGKTTRAEPSARQAATAAQAAAAAKAERERRWMHWPGWIFGRRATDLALQDPGTDAEAATRVRRSFPPPSEWGAAAARLPAAAKPYVRAAGRAVWMPVRGTWSALRWCASALHRATQPDSIESLLVIPGAHVKSVVIDTVYDLQNLAEEADPSSEAAKVLADPGLTVKEKIEKLESLRQRNAAPVASLAGAAPIPVGPPTAGVLPDPIVVVQKMLNDLGYMVGPADGAYGKVTRAAVQRFQWDRGLEPDGKAGPHTLMELQAAHQQWSMARTPAAAPVG